MWTGDAITNVGDEPGPVAGMFDSPLNAFAMVLSGVQSPSTVILYDSSDNEIARVDSPNPAGFVGLISSTPVELFVVQPGGADKVLVDDFRVNSLIEADVQISPGALNMRSRGRSRNNAQAVEFAVERARLRMGRGRNAGEDSLSVSGTIDLTAADAGDDEIMVVAIENNGSVLLTEELTVPADDLNSGRYRYRGRAGRNAPGGISMCTLDLRRGAFRLNIDGVDLSELGSDSVLRFELGSYSKTASLGL